MHTTRVSILVVVCAVLTVTVAASQTSSRAPSQPQPPRFRIAVDAVSIDAVVIDRNGEVVRDLTAADFEILQDGKPQKVTFAQFVPVMTTAATTPAAPAASAAAAAAPTTAAAARSRATPVPSTTSPITRDQMRRTIVIV